MNYPASVAGAPSRSLLIPHRPTIAIRCLALISVLLIAPMLCSAIDDVTLPQTSPSININPNFGPPTTILGVAGSGFDPYATVDVYFDSTHLARVVTTGAGVLGGTAFGGVAIQVPRSAIPGNHWITAVERLGSKAAQNRFLVRTDWAQFHFSPDHKGVNPYETMLSPTTVGDLRLRWTYQANNALEASPAIVNDVLYIATTDVGCNSSGYLYALNADTGALLWTSGTNNQTPFTPAVADGLVFLHFSSNCFYQSLLYAYDANTGALIWTQQTNDREHGPIEFNSPFVANHTVFAAGEWNAVAFSTISGAELWHNSIGGISTSTGAVANGTAYFEAAVAESTVYAFDANSGEGGSMFQTQGDILSSALAIANGMVYVGDNDGNVYACCGAMSWIYGTGSWIESSPAVANGVVYVGSDDGNLYALDANTGMLIWQYPTGGGEASPAVANGVVYVGSNNGNLYALSAKTGALLWQYATGGPIYGSPAILNGMLYIGSGDGNVYAFGLSNDLMSKKFSPPARPDPKLLVPGNSR